MKLIKKKESLKKVLKKLFYFLLSFFFLFFLFPNTRKFFVWYYKGIFKKTIEDCNHLELNKDLFSNFKFIRFKFGKIYHNHNENKSFKFYDTNELISIPTKFIFYRK